MSDKHGKRQLVRWDDDKDKQLLLCMQYACATTGIRMPWEAIAKLMGDKFSGGACQQHLAKLRTRMNDEGLPVPPPLARGLVTSKPSAVYTGVARPILKRALSESNSEDSPTAQNTDDQSSTPIVVPSSPKPPAKRRKATSKQDACIEIKEEELGEEEVEGTMPELYDSDDEYGAKKRDRKKRKSKAKSSKAKVSNEKPVESSVPTQSASPQVDERHESEAAECVEERSGMHTRGVRVNYAVFQAPIESDDEIQEPKAEVSNSDSEVGVPQGAEESEDESAAHVADATQAMAADEVSEALKVESDAAGNIVTVDQITVPSPQAQPLQAEAEVAAAAEDMKVSVDNDAFKDSEVEEILPRSDLDDILMVNNQDNMFQQMVVPEPLSMHDMPTYGGGSNSFLMDGGYGYGTTGFDNHQSFALGGNRYGRNMSLPSMRLGQPQASQYGGGFSGLPDPMAMNPFNLDDVDLGFNDGSAFTNPHVGNSFFNMNSFNNRGAVNSGVMAPPSFYQGAGSSVNTSRNNSTATTASQSSMPMLEFNGTDLNDSKPGDMGDGGIFDDFELFVNPSL